MMMSEIRQYLNNLRSDLRLDSTSESDILRELYTHLEDETDELCQTGLTRKEAAKLATERFGSIQALAREFHQVYDKGTLFQALLAALPHLLIALTFILHLWQGWHWMAAILVSMMLVTVYQWRRGKPAWLCPWLGYCLAMAVVLALILWQVVPHPWLWLFLLLYVPFALWLLTSILFRIMRRDWLLASLMMLPFPVAIGWLLALEQKGLVYDEKGTQLALTFLTLGLVTAAFIQLRKRLFKAGLLLATTLIMLIIILPATAAFFALSLLLTSSLMLPRLLEHKMGREQWPNDAWEQLLLEKDREADLGQKRLR
jgi:hypothetical protein